MPIIACSAADCLEDAQVKGMCRRHYNKLYYQARGKRREQQQREANPRLMDPFTCQGCGVYVPSAVANVKTKHRRKFCSRACNSMWHTAKVAAERAAARQGRVCKQCGCDISSRKPQAKFCSQFCSNVSRGAVLAAPLPQIECALEGCNVVFTPKTKRVKCCCENHGAIHCNRKGRASGRYAPEPWNERRKANHHKRRAQKRGTQVEDIQPIDIYQRDIWLCGICETPVDPDSKWPDPASPSLDHILPLSLGGAHTYENVQLAHLTCNVSKGNRIAA